MFPGIGIAEEVNGGYLALTGKNFAGEMTILTALLAAVVSCYYLLGHPNRRVPIRHFERFSACSCANCNDKLAIFYPGISSPEEVSGGCTCSSNVSSKMIFILGGDWKELRRKDDQLHCSTRRKSCLTNTSSATLIAVYRSDILNVFCPFLRNFASTN
jgi:hypothetical protein